MARSRLPDPLDRRHVLARGLAPEKAGRIADAYLEEGRRVEALDFLAKAEASEKLAELRRAAVAEGDLFLLRAAARVGGEPVSAEEYRQVAAAARAAGKLRYAQDAERLAEAGEE